MIRGEQIYSAAQRMQADGLTRAQALKLLSEQTRRPVDSLRRDYNAVRAKLERQFLLQRADTWEAAIETRRKLKDTLTVMHLCDVHFPHQRDDALSIAYQLTKLHQPDVVVVGSDEFDLALLSDFDHDPDEDETTPDLFERLRPLHEQHIAALERACPTALIVCIEGNHEARFARWINKHAPKVRKTLQSAWRDLVTLDGRIYALDAREVEIADGFWVRHGDRHNLHAAKALIEQEAYQVNVIAGHTHRPQVYYAAARKYSVTGATSGCLCTLEPKYAHGRPTGWQLGTLIARYHQSTRLLSIDNVIMKETRGQLTALSVNELLRA